MKREFIKKTIIAGISSLIISNMYYIPASARWINDSKNNWNWVEGEVKATGWKEIDKKWYYFNKDGIMSTDWLKDNEKWYYLSSDGVMTIGWSKINEIWYHFDDNGTMSTGWINDNGTWYYANSSGVMETGTIGIDGQTYTFSESGAMLSNKETITQNQTSQLAISSEGTNKNEKEMKEAYVSTNGDTLNIRSEASVSSNIIGTFKNGAKINIIDNEKDGFYPIDNDGTKGWVSSQWISFDKIPTEIPVTNSNNSSKPALNNIPNKDKPLSDDKAAVVESKLPQGSIRDVEPSPDDKHYYSDLNIFYKIRLSPPFFSGARQIKGNCTWYAWGRAWEITGKQPSDAGFIGNAYEWWEANKKSGKYQYGLEPRVGSIAVWKSGLPGSGGCGHVAIVEKIENGKVYISESQWHGVTFKYKEIYETNYLYGYIYLDKANY